MRSREAAGQRSYLVTVRSDCERERLHPLLVTISERILLLHSAKDALMGISHVMNENNSTLE